MLEHATIRSLILIKLQQIRPTSLLKFDSNTDASCEFCAIFKNTYFEEHLPTDASMNKKQQETQGLLGKKNESLLVTLENYSYLNVTQLLQGLNK